MDPADKYEEAFYKLEFSSICEEAWLKNSYADAISFVSSMIKVDLQECAEWITNTNFPFYETDVLEGALDLAQFKRRIGNYLLFKLFNNSKHSFSSLSDFVAHKRNDLSRGTNTWVNPIISFHMEELRSFFSIFGTADPLQIDSSNAKHFFKDFINICDLQVPETDLKEFYDMIDLKYSPHTHIISFEDFITTVEEWAKSHSELTEIYKNMLAISLIEYKTLKVPAKHEKILTELVTEMEKLMSKIRPPQIKEVSESLNEIFCFYARAQFAFGISPTFDSIGTNNSTWNLSKFLKFSRDFRLKLPKSSLTDIFKRTAENTRVMSVSQFVASLDLIATTLFNSQYDKSHNTNYAPLTLIEKRKILYSKLSLENPKKRLRAFAPAFTNDKHTRISRDDPSKKYVFKLSPKLKEDLERWREIKKTPKITQMHTKSAPRIHKKPIRSNKYTKGEKRKNALTFEEISLIKTPDLPFDHDWARDTLVDNLYGPIVRIHQNNLNRGLKVIWKLYDK